MNQRFLHIFIKYLLCVTVFTCCFAGMQTRAEAGCRLLLRYDLLPERMIKGYQPQVMALVMQGNSPTLEAIRNELTSGCEGLLGQQLPMVTEPDRDGAILVGTPGSSPLIANLKW